VSEKGNLNLFASKTLGMPWQSVKNFVRDSSCFSSEVQEEIFREVTLNKLECSKQAILALNILAWYYEI